MFRTQELIEVEEMFAKIVPEFVSLGDKMPTLAERVQLVSVLQRELEGIAKMYGCYTRIVPKAHIHVDKTNIDIDIMWFVK